MDFRLWMDFLLCSDVMDAVLLGPADAGGSLSDEAWRLRALLSPECCLLPGLSTDWALLPGLSVDGFLLPVLSADGFLLLTEILSADVALTDALSVDDRRLLPLGEAPEGFPTASPEEMLSFSLSIIDQKSFSLGITTEGSIE